MLIPGISPAPGALRPQRNPVFDLIHGTKGAFVHAAALTQFHLRAYVLVTGSYTVHLSRTMLSLFAGAPYTSPTSSDEIDLRPHLTNTCLQVGPHHSKTDARPTHTECPYKRKTSCASSGIWKGRLPSPPLVMATSHEERLPENGSMPRSQRSAMSSLKRSRLVQSVAALACSLCRMLLK